MDNNQFLHFARQLYAKMPGAPPPPNGDWGQVKGNPHWNFCCEIITSIDTMISGSQVVEFVRNRDGTGDYHESY
jgi:hypothetical protein